MNYMFKECIVLLVICTFTVIGDSFSTVLSDPPSSLRVTLKRFSKPRHHESNPLEKEKIRCFIKKSFQEFGLYVWTEYFVLSSILPCGENIVGMLSGINTGTADDRIVIVGAHYDTTRKTRGVDDNGSGVTALLEVAKQIRKAGCRPQHTIMFVAFDYEEDTIVNRRPLPFGSKYFVRNLTRSLQKTGGTVEGALILEMVANHNTSKDSQLFPRGFAMVCPKAYEEVKEDGNRGNFLAVVGRAQSDKLLLSSLKKHYQNDSLDYRVQLVPFPLTGQPRQSPNHKYLRHFYRSDHYSFWENTVSFKAVMLTDTSHFRRNMDKCYHRKCDGMKQIRKNDLEFLHRNINAVIQTVLELSKADFCNSTVNAAMCVTFNVVLLKTFVLLVFIFTK